MVGAGNLDRRLRFEKREEQDNGYGSTVSNWVLQFTEAANRVWLRGGETVMAARLESRQPVIITIRNSSRARAVTSDWRAVDTRDGRVYNLRENPKESGSRGYLEMLAEGGVAT
jgi:SPP1 family predicted phage head-tail adaptor